MKIKHFRPLMAQAAGLVQTPSRPSFTLVELLISIAIVGLLSAMMFTNFSKEKERNAIKGAFRQLQADLQSMQTNAVGGIDTSGAIEDAYGVYFPVRPTTTYTLFANTQNSGQYIYNSAPTAGPDVPLATRTLPPNVQISAINHAGASLIVDGLSINFVFPSGQSRHYTSTVAPATPPVSITPRGSVDITLKNTLLNVCYTITVTSDVGTISLRKLVSC